MEPTREQLQDLAAMLGVRPEVLEKLVRLLAVLGGIRQDEDLRNRVALKGGTALNVFWLPLPRLSVDIDLNFIGAVLASELTEQRSEFEQRVTRACQLAGCRVAHSPSGHAGGKFRRMFAPDSSLCCAPRRSRWRVTRGCWPHTWRSAFRASRADLWPGPMPSGSSWTR